MKKTILIALVIALALTFTTCKDDDNNGGGGSQAVAPTITTSSLSNGTVGTEYRRTLTATGDTPITWSHEIGTLPTGLTLSTAGLISGTPTNANTFSFTVKATNAKGDNTKTLSIVIDPNGPRTWTAVADSTIWENTIESSAHHDSIHGIAYGNNRFVAGGEGGKMAYSSDNGVTWTAVTDSTFPASLSGRPLPYSYSINGIAYGNNRFVAVGDNGKIAYSDNGITWTAVADSTIWDYTSLLGESRTADIEGIAYGNYRFVAVGSNGKMAYSRNGTSWTPASDSIFTPYNSPIRAIAYGNNRFVAVGEDGKMAYSDDDGENWIAVENSTFPDLYNIPNVGGPQFHQSHRLWKQQVCRRGFLGQNGVLLLGRGVKYKTALV